MDGIFFTLSAHIAFAFIGLCSDRREARRAMHDLLSSTCVFVSIVYVVCSVHDMQLFLLKHTTFIAADFQDLFLHAYRCTYILPLSSEFTA